MDVLDTEKITTMYDNAFEELRLAVRQKGHSGSVQDFIRGEIHALGKVLMIQPKIVLSRIEAVYAYAGV
jgi:hypothetical protein